MFGHGVRRVVGHARDGQAQFPRSDEVDVFMTLPSREGEQFAAARNNLLEASRRNVEFLPGTGASWVILSVSRSNTVTELARPLLV